MSRSESAATAHRREAICTALLLIGLAMIALSVAWPRVVKSTSAWSDEKALAYQSASAELHRLSMQAAGRTPENQTRAHQDELAEAESRYASLRTELDAVRERPSRIATWLRYAGILCLVVGILGQLAKRGAEAA